ncbi:MAG: hypothetical protein JWS10_3666 [Cypionkella sp.]|nr:hypothetical protein [Cypionkella sp.]
MRALPVFFATGRMDLRSLVQNVTCAVTLPLTFIQRERDSGFEFCPFGRVGQRGLARSFASRAASGPVAGRMPGRSRRRCQPSREWAVRCCRLLRQAASVTRAWCSEGNRVSFMSSSRSRPLTRTHPVQEIKKPAKKRAARCSITLSSSTTHNANTLGTRCCCQSTSGSNRNGSCRASSKPGAFHSRQFMLFLSLK